MGKVPGRSEPATRRVAPWHAGGVSPTGEPRSGGVSLGAGDRVFSDEAAWFALGALSGPYLPWGSGAMRPAGLVLVCNDIVLNDRRRIVEVGSGISTVLLARLLTQRSGVGGSRLAAVEHDARWGRWVVAQLEREGVGDGVVVIDAPLRPLPAADEDLEWYDQAAVGVGLDAVLGGELIDLLVVDGPPAFAAGRGLSRYPALPVLRERLAPGATVVLDDIERPGEQEIVRRWEGEFGLVFDRRAQLAGVAIATSG
jgi:predicted O-methyltransferase YrrM